jgi:DNA-binding response OmpR family regulator
MVLARPEWTLLALLLSSEGRVMFHDELLIAAFGPVHRGDTAHLSLAIARLRRKLGIRTGDEGPIRTVRGIGYAFDPSDSLPLPAPVGCRAGRLEAPAPSQAPR